MVKLISMKEQSFLNDEPVRFQDTTSEFRPRSSVSVSLCPFRNVPEGRCDRSLARSAWDSATPAESCGNPPRKWPTIDRVVHDIYTIELTID
jgi:hypothetical protein